MSSRVSITEILGRDNRDKQLYQDIFRWFVDRCFSESRGYHSWKQTNVSIDLSMRADKNQNLTQFAEMLTDFINKLADKSNFKLTEIGKWLIENHKPFWEEFHNSKLPKSWRLHAKRNYIKYRLDNLINSGIIGVVGTVKSQKNQLQTTNYKLTKFGILAALTLGAISQNNPNSNNYKNILFNCWVAEILTSKRIPKSLRLFLLIFLKNGFNSFSDRFLYSVLLKNHFTFNYQEIRGYFLQLRTIDLKMYESFISSLKELHVQTRELLLMQIKTEMEVNIANKESLPDDWELTRFNNISDCNTLVLLGKCSKCNVLQTIRFDFYEFLELPAKRHGNKLIPSVDCGQCGGKSSFHITPNCYYSYNLGS